MKEPTTKRQQLRELEKKQVWYKYCTAVLNRELNRLLRMSEVPREDLNNFRGLSMMAVKNLMKVQSKLGSAQRLVIETRARIVRLQNEIDLSPRSRKITFECWAAMLYDLAAIKGAEQLMAGDREYYREAYDLGRKITEVIDEELSTSPNLIINGRKIT